MVNVPKEMAHLGAAKQRNQESDELIVLASQQISDNESRDESVVDIYAVAKPNAS